MLKLRVYYKLAHYRVDQALTIIAPLDFNITTGRLCRWIDRLFDLFFDPRSATRNGDNLNRLPDDWLDTLGSSAVVHDVLSKSAILRTAVIPPGSALIRGFRRRFFCRLNISPYRGTGREIANYLQRK